MNVIELFDRGVLMNPEGTAFAEPEGGVGLTYRQAQDLSHRVAAALHREGIGAGTAVGVLSRNSVHTFPHVLGVIRAGCTWVALNARSAPSELVGLLDRVEAGALIVEPGLMDLAGQIFPQVPSLTVCRPIESHESEGTWLEPPGRIVGLPALDPEVTAAIFGSGGTTGDPKAVRLSHRSLQTMTLAMAAHMPEERPVHLVAAPMTHAAGGLVFPVLLAGGTNVVHDGVDPVAVLRSIERDRVTRLFLPPTAIYALLDQPDVADYDLSSLAYFIYGAAPMSVAKLKEALAALGPVMAQFYGQVELPIMCTFLSPQDHQEALRSPEGMRRLASCGRPSVVANVAVMDDDGTLLPAGEEGEVVVRSSLQMSGYHGDPAQSQEAFRPGGWLATGDIGVFDEDGYLYLRDRKRDLIISGGFNVFPAEIEQVLWHHDAVLDCAVIGVPDDRWGERVTAVVELKPGHSVDAERLIGWCRERLDGVKTPKAIEFATLPRSTVGKVLKRRLREQYWQGHDRKV